MSDTFSVTMLDVLRGPFESWLRQRELEMQHVPDTAEDTFVVVPSPELLSRFLRQPPRPEE